MELKPKYQYTYFVKPFIVDENKYNNYLLKLLSDKRFSLKIWEKEADNDMYSYFLPEIRESLFVGFEYNKNEIEEFKKRSATKQLNMLKKKSCVHFSYALKKDTPGKIDENGMFFGIEKIDIVCFNTGICFLVIKTYLDDLKSFSDILNFNYKFREINSDAVHLKKYEKISIQTDAFNSTEEFNVLIKDLVGGAEELEDERFYVYSYTCIDGENWNDKNTFDDIKIEFWKYSNILPSNYNIDISFKEDISYDITNWQYAKFGFNKNACVLLSSSLNSFNFTKLPFEFEKQYLYTYLLALYQKLYLRKLTKDFKTGKKLEKTRKNLNDFIKKLWIKEITKDDIGSLFYKKWMQIFELENVYFDTMNSYDMVYKEKKRRSYNISIKIMVALLSASLVISIVSLVMQL